ncbi:MAG TPA: CPBP family intramembrane glutamic endopeptidase [Candidatus Acidoferrum sp.]|jgi:membrane protease YdiL (CAAX protease family)
MNPFDDPSVPQQPKEPETPESEQQALDDLAARIVVHPPDPEAPISIDPNAFIASPPAPPPEVPFLPDDLRISWSWLHLLFFGLFTFGTLLLIQITVVIYFAAGQHLTQKQMEEIFQTKPGVAVGSNVLWFFLVFLFLYITLAVLHDRPFWPTLGWKKLSPAAPAPSNPWAYFAGGIGLAICVAIATSRMKTPEHLPIQDLFKNRTGAMLLMAMAVLVAPLIEETVFRGYLYPLFASSFSRAAMKFGGDPASALRTGTALGIALTGTLFGLLHGAQLGWTWGLVAMLVTVGIIFTFARARAGTVLASFLLHLGYNSLIAFSAIVSTRGFTQMPPHP